MAIFPGRTRIGMKLKNLMVWMMALGILCPLAEAAPPTSVNVVARVTSERIRDKKDKDADAKKDAPKKDGSVKRMEIRISVLGSVEPDVLTVKCAWLGRDVATKDKVLLKEDSQEAKLEGNQVVVVPPPAEFVTTEVMKKDASGKSTKEASGSDYRGWRVLVYNSAGTLIGKAYSSPAIEEDEERQNKK
jgi:hypothetical protein